MVVYRFKKFHLDAVDYFLISALISSFLTHRLHPKLREEASMERLKEDLIKQATPSHRKSLRSQIRSFINRLLILHPKLREEASMERLRDDLLTTSSLFGSPKSFTKRSQIKFKARRVYNALLDKRGGDLDSKYLRYKLVYDFGVKFRKLILEILGFLKNKELVAGKSEDFAKRFFYRRLRLILQVFLQVYKIKIQYALSNGVGSELVAIAVISGGAAGILSPWIPVLKIFLAPTVVFSTLLLKSVIQEAFQSINSLGRWGDKIRLRQILKDEEIDQQLRNLLIRSHEEFVHSDKIKMEDLNWNKNPEIRDFAQKLGVFRQGPVLNHKLILDPSNLDPKLERLFKQLGIGHGLNIHPSVRPKSKLVLFRDFIKSVKSEEGVEFLNDLEMLDAEIFSNSIRIKND